MDAAGSRRIAMPDDLALPPPEPFPVAALIQTEQDRWHTMGFDVIPYARLFGEMRRRIAGHAIDAREQAGSFDDAVRNQAVLDAARRSARQGGWTDVEID
jgi:predicted dehydrogenase